MARSANDIDCQVIGEFLDSARFHRNVTPFAEGYWIGRAIEHANQNAVDAEWLRAEMDERGLDSALIPEPKFDHRGQG